MKKFITTAAIVAALTLPALAEGTTDTTGESKANVKQSTTSPNKATQDQATGVRPGAKATTGMGSANTNTMSPSESDKSTTGGAGGGGGNGR